MSIDILDISLGRFYKKELREVYLLDYTDENNQLKKFSKDDIINLLENDEIEDYSNEMIYDVCEFRLTTERMNELELSFKKQLNKIVFYPEEYEAGKLKSAKERAVFLRFTKDRDDYIAIYSIPRSGKLEHAKVLHIIEKRQVEFVESSTSVMLPEKLTAIYAPEEKCFYVNDLFQFDQLLLTHKAKTKIAKDNFDAISTGKMKIAELSVVGLDKEWFQKLNYRKRMSLYRYDEEELEDITKEQIENAINHESISENKRLELKDEKIIIEDIEQLDTLIYLLSKRIILNLVTGESNV